MSISICLVQRMLYWFATCLAALHYHSRQRLLWKEGMELTKKVANPRCLSYNIRNPAVLSLSTRTRRVLAFGRPRRESGTMLTFGGQRTSSPYVIINESFIFVTHSLFPVRISKGMERRLRDRGGGGNMDVIVDRGRGEDIKLYEESCDVSEDENFKSGPWVSATDYVNANGGIVSGCLGDIKNFLNSGKLDQVVAIIKFCSPNVIGDLIMTMKDLSGTIPGTIHHKVIGEGGYGKDIIVRSALILANVSVFSLKPSKHYNENVVKVFRKDTIPGSESGSGKMICDSCIDLIVPNTRSNGGLDEATTQLIVDQVNASVNSAIVVLAGRLQAMVDASVIRVLGNRNLDGAHGERTNDVRGWMYKCEQFFLVDNVADNLKVHLASLHLFNVASMWHRQYIRENGVDVPWDTYKRVILQRFGNAFDDPLAELKNVRHVTTIEDYQNAFDKLVSRVDFPEGQLISFYLAGLQTEIELAVRMFRPQLLSEAYHLSRVQEDAIKANKQKYRTPLLPTPKFITNHNNYTPQTSTTVKQLPIPNTPLAAKTSFNTPYPKRQLSQKEFQERRDKNLVDTNGDATEENFVLPDHATPLQEDTGELIEYTPQISLHALSGVPHFRTMRVCGYVGKYKIHILIDSGSTHNFIDTSTAKRIGCRISATIPLQVDVADKNKIMSTSMCKQFTWQLQGETFVTEAMLVPLGGCEIVLGVQWLATLGNIQWNFSELRMSFQYRVSLPPKRAYDYKIALKEGVEPVNVGPYRHLPTQKDAIESMVRELLETGVIRESQSSFASPVVMVKKKDGSWRMCINYRQLNALTIKDKFPIPIIEEFIDELQGSKFFTKLDLRSGYHQIRMCLGDVAKTTFKTHERHYEFLVMPFGLTNAPATFQALMNSMFKKYLRKFALVFFDDFLVYSKDLQSYYRHLREVLGVLRHHTFYAKHSKCVFAAEKVKYLGHIITKEGVSTDDSKIAGGEIGFVLQQGGHPVAYFSKILAPRHQALSTYEKELLAVIQALITPPSQMKWLPKLMGFDYEILYKKGCENYAADALSRFRRKGKLVVGDDKDLKQALLKHFHADSVGGYSGSTATTNRISGLCYWKKLRQDVKTFVASCDTFQRSKPDLSAYPGLLQPLPIPNMIWSHISMDFIEGLPLSYGKSVILVVVDRLSKYNHFIGLHHPFTSAQVANVFIDHDYKLHGLPSTIVSDRDKTEVVNRCLETYLRCMTGEKPKEWFKWLSLAEYWYNTNFHTSIQTTPYEVVYGQPPLSPIAYVQGQSFVDAVDRSLSAREEMVQLLKFHMQRAQNKMKLQLDKKRIDRVFELDQIIAKVGQVAYKLLLSPTSQIYLVFHISQLELYKGPIPNVVSTLPICNPQGELVQQLVKVLDKRLGKVGNSSAIYVLIQWSNSTPDDATWELHSDIAKR
ncbi:reverse transcriptase [Tanacetum coccineum]